MYRQLPGAFVQSTANPGIVCNDYSSQVNQWLAQRTGGATAITLLPLTPKQYDKWSIIAVTVQAYLSFQLAKPAFGRLGKILTGLIPFQAQAVAAAFATPVNNVGNPPFQPLPGDSSMIAELWDPAVNDMPPSIGGLVTPPSTPLPISGTISPPVPRDLQAGDSMGLGIWMLPSIIGKQVPAAINPSDAAGLMVSNASFVVIYDDHL